jgi:uncharacterized protein YydD (DUF2326 family)
MTLLLTQDGPFVECPHSRGRTPLPDALVRSYEELVDFNRRLTRDRAERLEDQLQSLRAERDSLIAELQRLDGERTKILALLKQHDTIEKFREFQVRLADRQSEVVRLESELEQLDALTGLNREIRAAQDRIQDLTEAIEELVSEGNHLYSVLRLRFNEVVRRVLAVPAIISITVNKNGNPDFEAAILQREVSDVATSEDQGFSYRRLLCMAFDLALLAAHSEGQFFRFVYHDGAFEGFDDRKKLQLLEVVRDYSDKYDLQYILTAIDSDIPRDASGTQVLFDEWQIVRRLHDQGDDGRLFRMQKF